MSIDNPLQLQGLLRIGRIVGQTLQHIAQYVRQGITTRELDAIGAAFLQQHGAQSAPKITYNYPGYICISINDEAAHGIPGNRVIQAGDLVKLDVSAELGGFFADAAITVGVEPLPAKKQRLLACAKTAMEHGIAAAKMGQPINSIGKAAEAVARKQGYHVIRDLPGHGVGLALHESPTVPNHYEPRARQKLHQGLVITVEPYITPGKDRTETADDGWTLKTIDGQPVACFEHTIVIMPGKPLLVTAI